MYKECTVENQKRIGNWDYGNMENKESKTEILKYVFPQTSLLPLTVHYEIKVIGQQNVKQFKQAT